MADMEVRSSWQRQLRRIYASLPEAEKRRLSLEDRLLVFSAVSHVTAAALKSLGETEADQMEQTIYEEANESDSSFRGAGTRSVLRVYEDELVEILKQQEHRGQCQTAFVQIVLSQDTKLATILVVRRLNDTLVWQEEDLAFSPGIHQGVDYRCWRDISTEVVNHDYFNNLTGLLHNYEVSPLGQPSIGLLWRRIVEIVLDMGRRGMPDHIWIAPDGILASIPWQVVAANEAKDRITPVVTMVHGLRWVYLSVHAPEDSPAFQRYHDRGIQAWVAESPTPRPDLDIRDEVQAAFFGADNDSPAKKDEPGVSLSVVFGHGTMPDESPIPANEAVRRPDDWHDVRDSRICVLLSCYTGMGRPGALGDYVSISHKLSRSCKALIAPPVEVPHTAVLTLAGVFNEALTDSLSCRAWQIQEVYQEAVRRDPAVALFSLWGVGYEPLVWKSHGNR